MFHIMEKRNAFLALLPERLIRQLHSLKSGKYPLNPSITKCPEYDAKQYLLVKR